ncbi:hypothetical protein BpHYR1_002114, partial [Brachionus plicatilis]
SFSTNYFSDLVNKIDLRREVVKNLMNKSIDKYYESLLNDVNKHTFKFIDSIKEDFGRINTNDLRKELNCDENSIDYRINRKIMSNLRSKNLDENLQNFEQFKNIEFFDGETVNLCENDLCKFFGKIDSKHPNQDFNHPSIDSKTKSNKFKLIDQVGVKNIEELSTGELVYTSFSKPANFIIYLPENDQFKEIETGKNDIKFLLKSSNDELITIDSESHVMVWSNYKILNTYDIIKKNMLFIELINDTIIFMTDDSFLTKLNYLNGQIVNHFYLSSLYLDHSKIKNSSNLFFFKCYDVFKYNHETGGLQKSAKMNTIITVSKDLNKNECFVGTKEGEIIILDTNLITKLRKKCHSSSISSIISNYDGHVVSICVDGQIKVWKEEKLDLVNQFNVQHPIYARYLKNGKLAYIDKDLKFFVN